MSTLPVQPLPPSRIPQRSADAHKGTFGRVLVVAGSRGMSGAAVLCGSAALRGGAGLVQVACPYEIQPTVASGNPCYTTAAISHRADGTYGEASLDEVIRLAEPANVLALGPGLGNRDDVAHLVQGLLAATTTKPTVIDADGLNVLRPVPGVFHKRVGPLILTPHPGEFARLIGRSTAEVQSNRAALATEFAAHFGIVLILKGHRSIVTDGKQVFTNETGNPGMATGGCGDVLTGLVAALLAQGLSPYDAARLGTWVHGRAGDRAALELSQTALTATDLVDYLPEVFREMESV